MTTNLKSSEVEKDFVSSIAFQNELLRDLLTTEAGRDHLFPELSTVSLGPNQVLYEQGDTVDFVYFPIDSVVSVLAIMEDGTTVETSMVGREGLVGISALGSRVSRQWMWVSLSGTALQLHAGILERMFERNESALKSLLKCYRSLITQVSQRCACNTRHTILERLCCWLLMIHDRVGKDNLRLTQETIASRVGARRAGITVAAGTLQDMGGIEYRRGQLHIRDRGVLEHAVCECYSLMQADFKQSEPEKKLFNLLAVNK